MSLIRPICVPQLLAELSWFSPITYVHVWFPGSRTSGHELRLYVSRRVAFNAMLDYMAKANAIAENLGGLTEAQVETNRAGMCLCFQCGPEPRDEILAAVNAVRISKKLRPVTL